MNTRKELIESAAGLKQPARETALAFDSLSATLAEDLNQAMEARADLDRLIGEGNLAMMRNNHGNQFRYMGSVFSLFDPQSFIDTLLWVFRTYRAHGFRAAYWPASLDEVLGILRRRLDPEALSEVEPFYQWIIVQLPALMGLSEVETSPWEEPPAHGGAGA